MRNRNNAIRIRNLAVDCRAMWPAPCNPYICHTCPIDTVPSKDGLHCMMCGNSTDGIDPSTNDCVCRSDQVLRGKTKV